MALGYERHFNVQNPFDWMELISLQVGFWCTVCASQYLAWRRRKTRSVRFVSGHCALRCLGVTSPPYTPAH